MKKTLIIVAALVFAATAVASAKALRDHRLAARALDPVEPAVRLDPGFAAYDVAPGPQMRTFNLAAEVTLKSPGAAARVLFDFTDVNNHHYVEITPTSVQLVLVQNGVGRVLERVEGRRFAVNEPLRVLVKRRELTIRVAIDDALSLEACDETFYSGKVGWAAKGAAEVSKPRVQPVAEIYFADDFMRADEEKGPWTELRGNWRVSALDHASMSANAFQFLAQGADESAAVAGLAFWDDYSFEAAVRPQKAFPVGLYFYYRDENNYFRFEWSAEESGKPGSGTKQLVRVFHGERKVVAEQAGGFRLNQWYTMRCEAAGARVRAFIDGALVFDATDSALTGGMVGLYAAAGSRTYFDDVFVRSHRWFEDRFTNGGRTAWSHMGGDWKRVTLNVAHPPSGESVSVQQDQQQSHPLSEDLGMKGAGVPHQPALVGVLTVRTPKGEARAAVGGESWKNYVLETEIHPAATGRAGVLLCYQDETRYVQASMSAAADGKETWTLERARGDKRETMDARTIDAHAGSRKVRAGVKDGYVWVAVDGRVVLEGFDATLAAGRGGLFAADAAPVSFGPVRVDWPLEEAPLLTLNEIFEHEDSMSDWATVESDWFRTPKDVWINKGNFPGDATASADVTSFGKSSDVGILLSSDGTTEEDGYVLRLAGAAEAGKGARVELRRRGETIAEAELARGTTPAKLTLRRVGSWLIGIVNRDVVLAKRDPSMLTGDVFGWYARSAKVDARTVAISSPNVRKDLFRKAHTDWRVVKGIWEISNRWQCDPRWSFFSGRSSWQLAAIWNKHAYDGNVTMDFYAGPKMDKDRGNNYQYFADVNCTLAGDGADLTSGYSFMFGGWNNTKTVLVKGNKILAEGKWPAKARQAYMKEDQPAIIPTAVVNVHHEWFHVKAQKSGNRLRYWIDDELLIDYTDNDQPSTGNRAALWTWNNGIMVARVALSADRIGECESPDIYLPSQCRCVYDAPASASATEGTTAAAKR